MKLIITILFSIQFMLAGEVLPIEIPLKGEAAERNLEMSGLAWYGDNLILMPQYVDKEAPGFYYLSKESINEFLKMNAFHSKYREIVGYVNSPEIVSTDFYSSPFASIVDSQATIASGNRVTLYCWYDNEYGYSKQVVNLTKKIAGIKLPRLPLSKDK